MTLPERVESGALLALLLALLLVLAGCEAQVVRYPDAGGSPRVLPELEIGRSATYDYDPPVPGSYSLPPLKAAGDGRVLGIDGSPQKLSEILEGRLTILSFIYTRCGDATACPHATAVLHDIRRVTKRDPVVAENLRLVTLSFDPRHDTPSVMADYSQALGKGEGSEWLFLTTPGIEDLAPLLEAYGQRVDRKKSPDDPLGPFHHQLRVYLIDRSAVIRNIYSHGLLDPRLVMADVRTLLLEEKTRG